MFEQEKPIQSSQELVPAIAAIETPPQLPEPVETRFLKKLIFSDQGLRVGWSIGLFFVLTTLFALIFGTIMRLLFHPHGAVTSTAIDAFSSIRGEMVQFLALLGAAIVSARLEKRQVLDYNLQGSRRGLHFVSGTVGGFLALSALIAALFYGGWIHFGTVALSGTAVFQFGVLWGIGFLLTGLSEEGMVRCYMQFTLTRGIDYWWALGTVGLMSLICILGQKGEGRWGVVLMAGLGVLPCLWLQLKKSPSAGFWQAAWLTSTFFGFIHTGNDGETWIGIFSAAAIGFIFCVSIRLTGSAWWAIGFHAAWDWAQTFFFGTADSGFQPVGHYLTTSPTGPALWSGGTDGPEGSLLVIPTILVTLVGILAVYGRRRKSAQFAESASSPEQAQLS